jgi:hypothetical protein
MNDRRTGPGLFARGEARARSMVIQIGAGVMARMVGGAAVGGFSGSLDAWVGSADHPVVLFVAGWMLARVWLWGLLPALGWGAGRVMEVRPERFALVAGLSGEVFDVLLDAAGGGLEAAFVDWPDVLARVATLALGLWLTAKAVGRGRHGAKVAREQAEAIAARNAAEYAEMMARACSEKPQETKSPRPPGQNSTE